MKQTFKVLPKDKVYGCYSIQEETSGQLVGFHGKVFRTKCLDKAVETRMRLEELVKLKEKEDISEGE